MYVQVATKLSLGETETQYSQAVSMEGANAVQIEATAFNISGSVAITLEGSNDLDNWEDDLSASITLQSTPTPVRYATDKETAVAYAYVRLKYVTAGASGFAIVAAGINTANL